MEKLLDIAVVSTLLFFKYWESVHAMTMKKYIHQHSAIVVTWLLSVLVLEGLLSGNCTMKHICHICDDMSKGGRPKKSSSGGRPSHLKTHIQSVACSIPPFSLTQVVDDTYIESITCRLCKCAINDPVEVLPCKSLICCSCVIAHLEKWKDAFTCPRCGESHECTSSSFSRVSPMEEKMIKNMMIKCNKCNM